MAKIRTVMIVSYLVIISLMLALVIFFNVLHNNIENRYDAVTSTLVLENAISRKTSEMIALHMSLLQDINNPDLILEYNLKIKSIHNDTKRLDKVIVFSDSSVAYDKLKNVIIKLENESAQSLQNTRNKNFTRSDYFYNTILQDELYIKTTTITLVMNELTYAEKLQSDMDKLRKITFSLGIAIVFLVVIFCVFLAYRFSNKISSPLVKLSGLAKDISDGNISRRVDKELIEYDNEIGSLSDSFNTMIIRLNYEIESQKVINASLKETQDSLAERNAELAEKDEKLASTNLSLEKLNSGLQMLNRQKDEFISVSAHELKTPLTSIRGFAQILEDENMLADKQVTKHYLQLIGKNTDRLYSLVVDLVDSSRLNLGKLRLNVENVDVYKMFEDIKENMTLAIKEKGLTPEFHIDEGLPMIKADAERTMQVLRNFISNSIKFTTHGLISLHVKRDGEFVKFEVKDTGQGIPKESQSAIFSRFYQVDSTMTRKVGGSGLGLSICKGLVENMGGQIGFESEIKKGSVFYFTIPIANSTQTLKNATNDVQTADNNKIAPTIDTNNNMPLTTDKNANTIPTIEKNNVPVSETKTDGDISNSKQA